MRLLLLPAYFYPESVSDTPLDDARYQAFADAGIEMSLFTPVPTRNVDNADKRKYSQLREEVMYDGMMHVHRFSMMEEGKNPVGRAFRYFWCAIKQLWYGLKEKDVDLVFIISTPPIQGLIGALLKKVKHIPFVYNLQDIFPESLVGTGLAKKGGLFWKIGRIIENYTYRNADKIIVISEDFKHNIMAKGVPEEKIEVVYNWVDEKSIVDIQREDNILFERYELDRNCFYLTYNGNIGLTQNIDMLLDVAKELECYEDIQFILVGEGVYKEKVKQIVQEKQIKNIKLLPFQPYEEISHVFSLGDVSLVISKPEVGANSVPSKTWGIMSASRPVLASFDENELKDIIEKNNCGVFTKAGDKEAFKEALLQLYYNRDLCKRLGKNGRRFVMENLTKDVGTQKYVEILNSSSLNPIEI